MPIFLQTIDNLSQNAGIIAVMTRMCEYDQDSAHRLTPFAFYECWHTEYRLLSCNSFAQKGRFRACRVPKEKGFQHLTDFLCKATCNLEISSGFVLVLK
jgi:hypothetical protein